MEGGLWRWGFDAVRRGPRMSKGNPPTAELEEIAEMLGAPPEKTFKVDHEGMGKVKH